jgi:hypothetical protein
MNSTNVTRATTGTMIMAGLIFYQPLAYLASGAMILAGLSGT